MRQSAGGLELSASDLVGHSNCRHLTQLDLRAAMGELDRPFVHDPMLDVLRERGARHEAEFLRHLEGLGRTLTTIGGVGVDDGAVRETEQAMREGRDVIVQAALRRGAFGGRADVLVRTDRPSALGGWSYEVADTKLARDTKAGTVLQLSLYSDLVGVVQGLEPEHMYVVAPWTGFEPQVFRVADFAAYFRRVQSSLRTAVATPQAEPYPEPNPHCDFCRWSQRCDARRRDDDHLSLVANISKSQIMELREHGIETLAQLADLEVPLPWRPETGSSEALTRVREQARVQAEGRATAKLIYEALPIAPTFGLCRLPEPSPGDVFLDFEGDPFVGESGLEYLTGYAWREASGEIGYRGDWALTRHEERLAFEAFIDFVMDRWTHYPDFHIYHYAPYEPAALKRLMGRYASRQAEVDRLLRGERFVDLYGVARRAIRASVESYSIKRLEPLFGFVREVPLANANETLVRVQTCLELGDPGGLTQADRASVTGYNRDDCISALRLRDWLEHLRSRLLTQGEVIDRPAPPQDDAPSEAVAAWDAQVAEVVERLTHDVPDDRLAWTSDQRARWTLAHCVDWHRREQKAGWWEHFRLAALDAEDLLYERAALSGLQFEGLTGGTAKAPIHRYVFPVQDCDLREEDSLRALGGDPFGSVHAIQAEAGWLEIKKRGDAADRHPEATYGHKVIGADAMQQSLMRIARHVAEHGLDGDGRYRAACDLLLARPPRLPADVALLGEDERAADAAIRIAAALQGGVLAIQGPPGAGKTFAGAGMICRLRTAGGKSGITASSHKVIRNLINEARKAADQQGLALRAVQKHDEVEPDQPDLKFAKGNPQFFSALAGDCDLGGGTAWLWSREEAQGSVATLFVDEAAQMSLANVLAVSPAASQLVLLGDPQQLDQPMQGSHPDGIGVSALSHILGGEKTIPEGQGLFLAETWRLHPSISAFTSELFYEGRLQSRRGLDGQVVRSAGAISGAGLRFCPVNHTGNASSSREEAERVRALFDEILGSGSTWVDGDGTEKPVTLDNILVMAPYNAHVFELQKVLPAGAKVGTVDKFQGQQAAIVLYAMGSSTPADAPRAMEFLYSLNRLNVATSRAKCLCVVVASPALFEADCRTPDQMRLANAFCRYLELATPLA